MSASCSEVLTRPSRPCASAPSMTVRKRTAVRFLSSIEGSDVHGLLGRVKTAQQLAEMGSEHYGASVILGDVGYECEEGFVGIPVDGSHSGLLKIGQ